MPHAERSVEVGGAAVRVWEKGSGAKVGFFAGFGGLPKWTPFLDKLSETRRVVAPSLPGFPGGGRRHEAMDAHLDWALAARDALVAAGLEGADLIGVSVGAALAADVAAIWPGSVRRLVLVGPLGLYDEREPLRDLWGLRAAELPSALCADPEKWTALVTVPEGADKAEWDIEQVRASEAAARLLWPLGDTRLARRLPRIAAPTLVLRGADDQVLPASYPARFKAAIRNCRTEEIAGGGHLAELDRPDAVAQACATFLAG